MQKLDPDYSIWDEPIYVHDDMKLMAEEMDKDGFVEEAPMPEDKASETYEEHDPVPKFKGKIVMPGSQPEPQPVHHNNDARPTLKYPELAFPYESLPPGSLKNLVDKACEGGLDPGLACPAIMALASSLPFKDRMDGAKINLYVCLLALVGAGKDTAIKRALNVLGIEGNQLIYTSYAPSGERSIAMLLGDKQTGTKNAPITTPGPLRHCIVTTELEDTLAKSRGETSSVLQAMQHYWDHNNKTYSDAKKGVQKVNCRLSWLTALPVGNDEISTDAFRLAFGEHTSHGIVDRMFFGFSERKFDGRRSRNWEVPFDFNNYTIIDDSPMENPNVKVQVERTDAQQEHCRPSGRPCWRQIVGAMARPWPCRQSAPGERRADRLELTWIKLVSTSPALGLRRSVERGVTITIASRSWVSPSAVCGSVSARSSARAMMNSSRRC